MKNQGGWAVIVNLEETVSKQFALRRFIVQRRSKSPSKAKG
jgi:hypothetical protein